MKLQHLSRIEIAVRCILVVIALPFALVCHLCRLISRPFEFVVDKIAIFAWWIGNSLLKQSDEVRNGSVRNEYGIRRYTASFAWKELKRGVNLK